MTSQRHWARQSWLTPLLGVAVAALLVFIGSTVYLVHTTQQTADRARKTTDCLNAALGARNDITQTNDDAQIAFVEESSIWAIDLVAAFAVTPGSPEAKEAAAKLIAETTRLAKVNAESLATLKANRAYRSSHPLGKC